jgi:hypothetical protein
VVVGGTDGVFLFPTVQYTHHHHHHHPIINACPNTIQNRKSPDDGPLDKNRIPPKNDLEPIDIRIVECGRRTFLGCIGRHW